MLKGHWNFRMDGYYLVIYFWLLLERTVNGQMIVSQNEGVIVTSSSQHIPNGTWYIYHVVDNNSAKVAENCKCCGATTNNAMSPWYKIDLRKEYNIQRIHVIGRQDSTQYLYKMEIQLSTTGAAGTVLQDVDTSDRYLRELDYTLPFPEVASILTLTLRNIKDFFVICELYVYAVCNEGKYGPDCVNTCGKCNNTEPCDGITGECSECINGYRSPQCQECIDGLYGSSCGEECGHCNNNDTCDKSNGYCPNGCSVGYEGNTCKQVCSFGKYGLNCSDTCGKCKSNTTCNNLDGTCTACVTGYLDPVCKDCKNGRYGPTCNDECGHCNNNDTCDKSNGNCTSGCSGGYQGTNCKKAIRLHATSNVPIGPIVGGGAGAVVVLAIVAIIVVFLLKRRRKDKGLSSSNQSFEDIQDNAVADAPEQKQPEASVDVNREENASPLKQQMKQKKQDILSVEDQSVVTNGPETENVYYSFLSKKSDLKICQLWDYIKFKKSEDCVIFYQEYSRLSNKLLHPYDVAMKPMNRGKNRYKSLFAYDHSRVPLVVEDHKDVEYINASFIDGYNKPHKFIASQGPIESMKDDFWRMVWQQKSKSIVMLTNLVENGSDKCILYWPTSTKKTVTYGKITIALLSEDSTVDYVIRHMEISKDEEDSTLSVTQFHYKAWPDKSYPDSTWSLVRFWLKVEEDTSSVTDSGPIVVHCSAGIGRTGTYIALDNAYYQAKKEGNVRILGVVKSLREQRVGMVQTKDQYVYLHEAVADALLFGTHFIWSSQFEDACAFLSQKEKGSYVTRLHTQFNIIVESIFDKRSVHTTVEDGINDYTNVFIPKKPAQVSIDEYRPKSKSLVYVREVGALILQNHEAKDAFIVCKTPTESRMTEFWSLIKEQNVKTIVSLSDMAMVSSKRSSFLGLKSKAVQDKFGLSLAEERKTSIFTERQINLKDSTDDTTIFHYEYNKWASGDIVPKDPNAMAKFVEAVLDRQRRLSETGPILVYCNIGAQRCGVICALLSEVYRMNKDGGNINIIETVKMMKERSDDIIPNVEQYVYIHDVILSGVQDHTYQN